MNSRRTVVAAAGLAALIVLIGGCSYKSSTTGSASSGSDVERGRYLVSYGGCNDCHSPKVFTPTGPVPDSTHLLAGHLGGPELPPVPGGLIGPNAWGAVTTNDLTAWVGPWGTSYAANLTPDSTGLGRWTADQFVATMRTGKHQGTGRPIQPPMPWQYVGSLNDDDIRAIFAYLKTIPPVTNVVPPPAAPMQ